MNCEFDTNVWASAEGCTGNLQVSLVKRMALISMIIGEDFHVPSCKEYSLSP
jgi:hypothetical protein